MNTQNTSIHGQWSTRLAFIMAATGSAVGLGNIWKFPYITGENGGGAFVIVYLLCIFLICLPVMIAEVMLGRRGRQSPINTMRVLAHESGQTSWWQLLGWSGVIAGFLILSYYSVVAGWALAYVPYSAMGTFTALPATEVSTVFNTLVGDPWRLLLWHSIFMAVTVTIVAGGVKSGLERAVQFMMPALFIVLLVLVGYAMSTEKFLEGFHFMFDVNFQQFFFPNCSETACEFSGKGLFAALGQAFFSLSLGMGAIMVYGAYLPKDTPIAKTTTLVAIADTTIAILAGLIIFPIVFSNNLEPSQGVGLAFNTLPIAFGQMPFGVFFGTLFFILLVLAAWSSAISLIEPAVAWLVETNKFTRWTAAITYGLVAWSVGLLTIFSFNIWQDVKPIAGFTWFKLIDFVSQNVMLPLGGLLIALFVAWIMKNQFVTEELDESPDLLYRVWRFLLRYVAPVGIGVVFLNAIGVLS